MEKILRQKIREALASMPNRPFTVGMIRSSLAVLGATGYDADEFRGALEWNQARGYIDFKFNIDLDEDEWFLTARGKQREGLSQG